MQIQSFENLEILGNKIGNSEKSRHHPTKTLLFLKHILISQCSKIHHLSAQLTLVKASNKEPPVKPAEFFYKQTIKIFFYFHIKIQ